MPSIRCTYLVAHHVFRHRHVRVLRRLPGMPLQSTDPRHLFRAALCPKLPAVYKEKKDSEGWGWGWVTTGCSGPGFQQQTVKEREDQSTMYNRGERKTTLSRVKHYSSTESFTLVEILMAALANWARLPGAIDQGIQGSNRTRAVACKRTDHASVSDHLIRTPTSTTAATPKKPHAKLAHRVNPALRV